MDKKRWLLAASSGLLMTAAFPKISLPWVAWFAFIPLLAAIRDKTVKESFQLGLTAGLAHFLSLCYWLVYTMHTYGYLPIPVSVAALGLLSAYLALYPALFAAGLNWLSPKPVHTLFMAPVLWTALEFVRSFFLTGFPWGLSGYSQFRNLYLIQIADIFGVWGVSFLIVLVNAALFILLLHLTKRPWQRASVTRPSAGISLSIAAACVALTLGYGHWRTSALDRQAAAAPVKRVAAVQGNIEQDKKWDTAFQEESIRTYLRLSSMPRGQEVDLVVWPETAIPFYFRHETRLSSVIQRAVAATGIPFLVGSPSFSIQEGKGVDYYNSAYLLAGDGSIAGKYDKVHLVPFGEYVPLRRWFPFLGKMVEQVGDFRPGAKGVSLKWGQFRVGPQICFEIIFPELSRQMVKNRTHLLVNITNDAWFGKTGAPYQHFAMAAFRAVENRRSLVRAANTGISGFVDPVGRIHHSTPLFQEAAVAASLPLLGTRSVYTRWGDWAAVFCLAAGIGAAAFRLRGFRRRP